MNKVYQIWFCVYEKGQNTYLRRFKTRQKAIKYCGDEMHMLYINKEQRII